MEKINYKILKVMAFSVIMLFMSSTVFAQVQENPQDTTAQDTTTQMNEQQQTMPQEQHQRTGDDMQTQNPDEGVNYNETIDQEELPQEVNTSLDELYPAHQIQEAYRGEDDSYKVKVKNETDEAFVYYDLQGDFLRAHNLSGLQQEGAMPQEQGQRTMEEQDQEQWSTGDEQNQQGTQQDTAAYQQDAPQDAEMQDEDRADSQEQYQQTDDALRSQDYDKGVDYSESIQEGDLPQDVTSSLDELYPAHQIQEINQGDDDSYKVKVKNEDDMAVVYYDSQGDFLRAQNLTGLNQEGALPQEQGQRIQEQDETMQNQQDTVGYQQDAPQEDQQDTQQGDQQEQWGTEDDTQDVEMQGEDRASPQEQYQQAEDMTGKDYDKGVDYSETIQKGDLPQEVSNSVDSLYPAHQVTEVFRGEDDSYKVKVKNESDIAFVYYNSQGDLLRAENVNGTQQQGVQPQEQGQRVQDQEDDFQKQEESPQQNEWKSDTAKTESSAYPQEQSQRMKDDMHSKMHGKATEYSEKIDKSELPDAVVSSIDETYPDNEISEVYRGEDDSYKVKLNIQEDAAVVYYNDNGEFLRIGEDEQQQTSSQEMNQRIEDVEESQDADRWGTEQRTPDYEEGQDASQRTWENDTTETDTLKPEGSAYPQEQQQEIEGNQDEEKFEDNWGTEDTGAHQSTWKDDEASPQEQNQQATDDDQLGDQDTWMGGEGTDTTQTPSRIDTTAVYKNQWEEGTFEEGDDTASPQEQYQQTDEWGDADTTDMQGEYETTPVDTTDAYNNQMMEDNNLDEEDTASPQEQYQQTDEWGDADTTGMQGEYGTTPTDTTDTYDDQMMEDNTLDQDDTASPQEQYQATGDTDVDYSEEIQENELPESVTSSLDDKYPDYEIEEVYRGDDDSYKVKIKKNEEKIAVYYDSDGLFYRDEVLDDILEDTDKDTNQDW